MRPLLYAPNGNVLAVETTNEDVKDGVLIEMFGLLAGVPACLERWKQMGGVQVATSQMIGAIVEVVGKERIEQAWGVTLEDRSRPDAITDVVAPEASMRSFADVERSAEPALNARVGPGGPAMRAVMTGVTDGMAGPIE